MNEFVLFSLLLIAAFFVAWIVTAINNHCKGIAQRNQKIKEEREAAELEARERKVKNSEAFEKIAEVFKTHPLPEWEMSESRKEARRLFIFERKNYPWKFIITQTGFDRAQLICLVDGEDFTAHLRHAEQSAISGFLLKEEALRSMRNAAERQERMKQKLRDTQV